MSNRAIVLDANILIRAVLGKRVRNSLPITPKRSNSLRQMLHMLTPESTFLSCWRKGV